MESRESEIYEGIHREHDGTGGLSRSSSPSVARGASDASQKIVDAKGAEGVVREWFLALNLDG